MLMTPGPRRLILIRSGNFDYAEVVMGNSTHLVGPNNVGKTSLIATVQFLYIAAFSEMRFNRPWDESQRYYFQSDESTILFETATFDGRFVTMGLRGRGQMGNYHVDRFAYEGAFRKEDFLHNDNRIRQFAEVKARLAGDHYFKLLEPGEIRAAAVGEYRDVPALNMGIVPLKDPRRYNDFVYLLKNLLRLNHLSQKDIKDTLLNVYRHDIKHAVEVDLYREYADHYTALTAEKAKLTSLGLVAKLAVHLKANRDARELARRDLPVMYVALVGAKARELTNLEHSISIKEFERHQLGEVDTVDEERKQVLETANNKISGDLALIQNWIGAVETARQELQDYLPDLATTARQNLSDEINLLTGKIVTAGNPVALESELNRAKLQLQTTIEQRDKFATLLGTWLQERLGKAAVADLGRIFHPSILRMPIEKGFIEIEAEEALVETLQGIRGHVQDGRFRAAGAIIPLDRVSPSESVVVADIATLNAEIDSLTLQIKRVMDALEVARNMEALKSQLAQLQKQLRDAEALARCHEQWLKDNAALPAKKKEAAVLQVEQTANLVARNNIAEAAKFRVRKRNDIENELAEIRVRQKDLANLRPVPADPSWSVGSPDPEWEAMDARGLNALYSQTRAKYDAADAEVVRVLHEAELVYQDGFSGPSDDERIGALIEAVDTLKERDQNFRRYLADVIKGMGATFNNMFQALNALRDSVKGINSAIGKVSISNLQELTLELVENTEITKHYRSISTSDLFDDMGKIDDAIKAIYAAIDSTRVLRLADWFGVRFVVTTASGDVRRYSEIASLESNGTTMAIKVLVNIVLIRAMMHNKKPFRLPFYIDEATQIDEANLKEIVALANEYGFCPVLASTVPAAVAENIDFVRRVNGNRAVIDPKWRIVRQGKVPIDEPA